MRTTAEQDRVSRILSTDPAESRIGDAIWLAMEMHKSPDGEFCPLIGWLLTYLEHASATVPNPAERLDIGYLGRWALKRAELDPRCTPELQSRIIIFGATH